MRAARSGTTAWQDVQPVEGGSGSRWAIADPAGRSRAGRAADEPDQGVRKKLSQELGFLVQSVHIRDNLDLAPNAYRITLNGSGGRVRGLCGSRDGDQPLGKVFGSGYADQHRFRTGCGRRLRRAARPGPDHGLHGGGCQHRGWRPHLSELLQSHAHELLGHDEVQQLLDNLAQVSDKLVEDLSNFASGRGLVGPSGTCFRKAYPSAICARSPKPWRSRRPKIKMPAL